MTLVAVTVDLVRRPDGSVWHLVAIPYTSQTVCTRPVPDGGVFEVGVDAHVVSHKGFVVCGRCRRGLQ